MSIQTATLIVITILLLHCITPATSCAGDMAVKKKQSQDQITWYRADFPPVSIPRGKQAEQGFFDKTMHFLIERLPDYRHQFQIANFKRIMLELENNKNVCCPSLYKTKERERFVTFSAPAMIVLPNGLITSEKNRKKLTPHVDADGKISLLSLLKDNNITLGISNGRIYSGGIDNILSQFSGQKNLLVRSGDDVFRGLMNMLSMGRIDCLLGYPVEAEYCVRENVNLNDFVYFSIKESSVPFTVGHIGCSNNEWGRNLIRQIDEIVKEHRDREFIEFYGEWLDDATRLTHRHMAEEFYKTPE